MRWILSISFVLLAGCNGQDVSPEGRAQEELGVQVFIQNLHNSLASAYNRNKIDTDSLIDYYYSSDLYYVTPWGSSEPIDSTKARLRNLLHRVKDYQHTIENLKVRILGNGAYAFFVLRQQYTIDGFFLDEYLPTTYVLERQDGGWKIIHSQRSTDYQTFQQYIALQRLRERREKTRK